MAMLSGDYKRRVQSTNRGAAVNSGYAVEPVEIPNGISNFEICGAGSVITLTSINVAPGSGGINMWFQDSAGTKQGIITGAVTARDYKQNFYCPWPVYIEMPDTTANVTVYVASTAKGATAD